MMDTKSQSDNAAMGYYWLLLAVVFDAFCSVLPLLGLIVGLSVAIVGGRAAFKIAFLCWRWPELSACLFAIFVGTMLLSIPCITI